MIPKYLELSCMRWLRHHKKCVIVINERSPLYHGGLPDVLGVTRARETTEIEVKRSMSDFYRNASKPCIRHRGYCLERWPKQYYFAVPPKIAEKAKKALPDYAGLLIVDDFIVTVDVVAPRNKMAKKLTIKQCVKLAECMANQIASQCIALMNFQNGERTFCSNGLDDVYAGSHWRKDPYINYQI